MKMIHVAIDVVIEAKRNSFFWLSLFLACLLILLFAVLSGTNVDFHYESFLHAGLTTIWLIHILLALLLTTETIYAEDERKSVYFYLSRDLSRLDYLRGKFIGCFLSLLISLSISSLIMILAAGSLVGFEERILGALMFIVLELGFTTALIIFLSRLVSKLTNYLVFGILFILSNFVEFLILKSTNYIGFLLLGLPSYKYYSYYDIMIRNYSYTSWLYSFVLAIFTLSICFALINFAALRYEHQTL